MKILLALTIILGGVLTSKNSYADASTSIISSKSQASVAPSFVNASAKAHSGDVTDCPFAKANNTQPLNFTAINTTPSNGGRQTSNKAAPVRN